MDCNSDQEQFSAYLLGALEVVEADKIDQHVDRCAPCSDILRAEGDVVVNLARLSPQIMAPNRIKRRLLSAIDTEAA